MKRKDFLRKCLAALVSGVLLAAMAVFPPAVRAQAASPSLRLTVVGPRSTICDQDVSFQKGDTAGAILTRALQAQGTSCQFDSSGFLTSVAGITAPEYPAADYWYWGVYDNDTAAAVGLNGFPPSDGDRIVIAPVGYSDSDGVLTQYPLITLSDTQPKPGETFSATVRYASTDWSTGKTSLLPLEGVAVTFDGQTVTTGRDGLADGLKAGTAGTFPLGVSKLNPNAPYDWIVPRTVSVTVTGTPAAAQTIGAGDTRRTLDLGANPGIRSLTVLGNDPAYLVVGSHCIPAGLRVAVRRAEQPAAYLDFPSATAVTGSGWDGVLALPHTVSVTVGGAPMQAVAVGGAAALTLSAPARLTLPGGTGKCAGYLDEAGAFHTIPRLSADSLGSGQDGYYDDGADLIVWTRHFSAFVTYSSASAVSEAAVAADIDGAGAWLTAHSPGDGWSLFALARAGKSLPADTAATVREEMDGNGGSFDSSADLEKSVLFLRAAGVDPADFYGVDLAARLCADTDLLSDGLNAQLFALLALDSADTAVPAGSPVNDAALIARILPYQKADGAFALAADQESDPDLTAMALTALAPHMDQAAVRTAADRALGYLSAVQQSDGGFIPAGSHAESAESAAQVVIALSTLKLDPQGYAPLLKTVAGVAHSALGSLLSFKSADGGFLHQAGGAADPMATQQALMALTAYRNYRSGAAALYDLRGVSVRTLPAAGSSGRTPDGSASVPTADTSAGETIANPKTGGGESPAPVAAAAVTGLAVCLLARRKLRRGV